MYKVHHWTEGIATAAVMGPVFYGYGVIHDYSELTEAEAMQLRKEDVNKFDRWVFNFDPNNFKKSDKASDYFMNSAFAMPFFVLIDKRARRDWLDISIMTVEAHMIHSMLYQGSVFLLPRPRPNSYTDSDPVKNAGKGKENSFFSGHVASTAIGFTLAAKYYSDYHQLKGMKRALLFTAAQLPTAACGYLRLNAGKHFPSDVLVGWGVGSALGVLVPELHKIKPDKLSIGGPRNGAAYGLSLGYQL